MSAIGLPVNVLAHFVPRPPVAYLRPARESRKRNIGSMSQYVELFETETPPPTESAEAPQDRKKRLQQERQEQHDSVLADAREAYRPSDNPSARTDPYKTLFVGRLAYETTERNLRRVFEDWGRVKEVIIVRDKDDKSRGYAFVEYEDERDLKDAYKHADGIKIDGRNVIVDVERARTVPGWFPRRLGGGKGPGREGFDPKQRKRKAPATQQYRRDSRPYQGDRRPRSPGRGGHYPPQKYPRDSRDGSRRSSFNY